MENAFRFADELGPTKVVYVYEPTIDLKGVLVVDNVAAAMTCRRWAVF
jgi:glutamate dehydrogenase (NAD(P)+)